MSIELEILHASKLEHFKYAKDLALIYPINHPKRIRIEKGLNEIIDEINKIDNGRNL